MSSVIHIPDYSDLESLSGARIPDDVTAVLSRSMILIQGGSEDYRYTGVSLTFCRAIEMLCEIDRLVCCLNGHVVPVCRTQAPYAWDVFPSLLSTGARAYYERLFPVSTAKDRMPVVIGSYRYDDELTSDTLYLVSVNGGALGVVRVGPHQVPVIRHGWVETVERYTQYRPAS